MNIIGRVTANAQVHTLKDERQVVNFSIATNDSYRDKQGKRVELTTYFNCAYWISAKVAHLLTKGSLVELSGRVYASAWAGNDGAPRATLNFHTAQIKLHEGIRKAKTLQDTAQPEHNMVAEQGTEDDLPF